jgi:hypothetical protein
LVLVDRIAGRRHRSEMTPEDHRQLAERCVRLAKASPKAGTAEYLMGLAASYMEVAELAGKVRQPAAGNKSNFGKGNG